MEQRRGLLAGLLVLGFTVSFALTNSLAGLAYTDGIDPLTVATVRITFPALVLAIMLRATGARFSLPKRDAYVAVALGVVTAIYTFTLLTAIDILSVSLAVLIFFTFPLFTSLIVVVVGWEKLTKATIIAALVAFGGLAMVLGLDTNGVSASGVIYGLIAGFGLAVVSTVSSRVIRSGDSRPVTLYMVTTAAVIFIAFSVARGSFIMPQSASGWVGLVGSSVFYATGVIGFFVAISMIGPAKTTLYSYVEPLFTMVAAYFFLSELLQPLQIVGALVVVGALTGAGLADLRKR